MENDNICGANSTNPKDRVHEKHDKRIRRNTYPRGRGSKCTQKQEIFVGKQPTVGAGLSFQSGLSAHIMAVNATVGAGSPRPPPIYRPGVAVPDIRIILLHA